MSSYPCSFCGGRIVGPAATMYVAWFTADGSRIAYKCWSCFECILANWSPLFRKLAEDNSDAFSLCPVDGTEPDPEDLDPVYVTLYLPKAERRDYAFQTHASCAVKLRGPVSERGRRQPDRGSMRGPSSTPNVNWESVA